MDVNDIRAALENGLLCFPVTDMDDRHELEVASYRQRVAWLLSHGPSAIFVAGGTGEFFSLTLDEYRQLVRSASEVVQGQVPVIASAGRSIRDAIAHGRAAQEAGADALLLMPPYLTSAPEDGLVEYVHAILDQTELPTIYYNRANGVLGPAALESLAQRHDHLIGLKDGTSNMQDLNCIIRTLGDHLSFIGGAPTAEIISEAYLAIGVNTYSSAVFNFVPEMANYFYQSLRQGQHAVVKKILRDFFVPFVQLRDTKKGYAVSMIKAGAALVGRSAGKVRPPLVMPTTDEIHLLQNLLQRASQYTM